MKNFKNNLKAMLPYIIINTVLWAIVGAIAGKNVVEIRNTKMKIGNDYEALRKFLKDMSGKATHIKLEDLDEDEVPEDIRKASEEAELKEELGNALVNLSETCENTMSLEDFLKR